MRLLPYVLVMTYPSPRKLKADRDQLSAALDLLVSRLRRAFLRLVHLGILRRRGRRFDSPADRRRTNYTAIWPTCLVKFSVQWSNCMRTCHPKRLEAAAMLTSAPSRGLGRGFVAPLQLRGRQLLVFVAGLRPKRLLSQRHLPQPQPVRLQHQTGPGAPARAASLCHGLQTNAVQR